MPEKTTALILDEYTRDEYTMRPEFRHIWVTIDNLSLYIVRNDEGVSVDIYPKNDEASDSLGGTWVLFSEADEAWAKNEEEGDPETLNADDLYGMGLRHDTPDNEEEDNGE